MMDRDEDSTEAWLSEDGHMVHLGCGGWVGSFPLEDLDRWLTYYRGQRDRRGGRFASIYAPDVRALEKIRLQSRPLAPGLSPIDRLSGKS